MLRLTALILGFALTACAQLTVRNARVIDLETGRVSGTRAVRLPGPRKVIDARGRFLMPALWDMHHQGSAAALLAQGITGARHFGTPLPARKGLRLLSTGAPIAATDPRQARAAFDQLWDADADFVAIDPGISRDAYVALAEQARHWRLPLAGPIPPSVSIVDALEARQASIESLHDLAALPAAKLDSVLEDCARWGTRLVSLLLAQPEPDAARVLASARRAKVEVLAGGGGRDLRQELEQMVRLGSTPLEALRSAALNPARFTGSAVDAWVLLEANPLEDIRNVRSVRRVLFGSGRQE